MFKYFEGKTHLDNVLNAMNQMMATEKSGHSVSLIGKERFEDRTGNYSCAFHSVSSSYFIFF